MASGIITGAGGGDVTAAFAAGGFHILKRLSPAAGLARRLFVIQLVYFLLRSVSGAIKNVHRAGSEQRTYPPDIGDKKRSYFLYILRKAILLYAQIFVSPQQLNRESVQILGRTPGTCPNFCGCAPVRR